MGGRRGRRRLLSQTDACSSDMTKAPSGKMFSGHERALDPFLSFSLPNSIKIKSSLRRSKRIPQHRGALWAGSDVWVQTHRWRRLRRCCEAAPPNPRPHYSPGPAEQHTDAGTSPLPTKMQKDTLLPHAPLRS